MKGCVSAVLLLLFCLSAQADGAQAGAEPAALVQQPDHCDELREVKDMVHRLGATVVELREKLRRTEEDAKEQRDAVQSLRATVAGQAVQLGNAEARLAASEGEAKELRDVVVEQRTLMRVMADKLSVSESHVAELQSRQAATELRVTDVEKESEAQLSIVETRLNATDDQVQELRQKPKVAFSASLGTTVELGPFNTETPLIFKDEPSDRRVHGTRPGSLLL